MDLIRRLIRGFLGPDSGLYQSGSRVLDFLTTTRKDGLNTWRILTELREGEQLGTIPKSVTLRNLKHPMLIRPGTEDVDTVINNVIREEYGHFTSVKDPKWMIDAGAYIGDTTAYFLSRFANLKVIALEPHPANHEMAAHNLKAYGDRALLLRKGLFSGEQTHCFGGDGTGASIANSGSEIECVTITSLMEQYSIPHVDILKMDIEGAEEAVFASTPDIWLNHTGLLIIEIHGPRIKALIRNVLYENGFSIEQYRSLWYCKPTK